jgi:hypothetical protein
LVRFHLYDRIRASASVIGAIFGRKRQTISQHCLKGSCKRAH